MQIQFAGPLYRHLIITLHLNHRFTRRSQLQSYWPFFVTLIMQLIEAVILLFNMACSYAYLHSNN